VHWSPRRLFTLLCQPLCLFLVAGLALTVHAQIVPPRPNAAADSAAQSPFSYLEDPDLEPDLPDRIVLRDGKVLKTATQITFKIGPNAGQIRFEGSGGFAAYGKDQKVRLNGTTSAIIWGSTPHFLGANDILIFGADDATATIIWDKQLHLGGGTRTIRVTQGVKNREIAAVRFTQALLNGSLIFEGDGRADLATRIPGLGGSITIREAELRTNDGGVLTNLSLVRVEQGGQFTMDNYLRNSARLGDGIPIELDAGHFALWGQKSGTAKESVGVITLTGGASVIDVASYAKNNATQLAIAGLVRSNGSTLNLTNSTPKGGVFSTANTGPRLSFHKDDKKPTLTNGILPWATVNGADFATIKGVTLVGFTDYDTRSPRHWTEKTNAAPDREHIVLQKRSVNSLKLNGGRIVRLDMNAELTIGAGLLATGPTLNKILDGSLRAPNELFAHVYGTGGLDISSALHASLGLTKTGDGVLRLTGTRNNRIGGATTINQGALILAKTGGALALGGNITVGDRGNLDAILRIEASAQIDAAARVTLRGRAPHLNGPNSRGGHGIFQFGGTGAGGIEQTLHTLRIEGSGILDFQGGSEGTPNILYLEILELADADSHLLVRGWSEFIDHLLVSRNLEAEVAQHINQITFEGFDTVSLINYDAHCFEIAPVSAVKPDPGNTSPEPACVGAVLAACGLGFFAWRKRCVANK